MGRCLDFDSTISTVRKIACQCVYTSSTGLQGNQDDSKESFPQSSIHPVYYTAHAILVGNNELAVEEAANKARELNCHPVIIGTQIVGETKEIANVSIAMARYLQEQSQAKLKNPHGDGTLSPGVIDYRR